MNFKDSYTKDNENIKPRKEVLVSLKKDIKKYNKIRKNYFNYKIAASIVTLLCIILITILPKEKAKVNDNLVNNTEENKKQVGEDNNYSNKSEGIYIPKQQIEKINPNIQASRIATLVYKGRVYTMESSIIPVEYNKNLLGKRLGITWDLSEFIVDNGTSVGYIDLESLDDFASFSEGEEVYTVKGYDENFRLITYSKSEHGEFITIWECLNDFTLKDGSDVFGKMNIKGNIETVTWDTFDNWNNGNINEKEIVIDENINNFIDSMYEGVPYSLEDEELRERLFYKENKYSSGEEYLEANVENQRLIFFKMKDGTKAEIRLFKDGYVYYSGLNFAFKLDEESFNNMWNELN
ncbi:MAG: hypothetical protein HUJ77_14130 [Clostridium sp.]|uniref:hypothetical protein n=1 Tax=Clostridium sp. TaxID=1506 RepID=UPI0025B7F5EC|nr:hypothetical protein [Clostridium sp.]MCF0149518.1 hypothetical protein [Clostridium sp.]